LGCTRNENRANPTTGGWSPIRASPKTIVNTTTLGGRYLFTAGQPGKPYRIWVRAERTGVGTGPYASLASRTNP